MTTFRFDVIRFIACPRLAPSSSMKNLQTTAADRLWPVTVHQHRRMLHLELLQESNCAQKNFRPVAWSINKFDNLDLIHSEFIRFHSQKAPIQAQNRADSLTT